MSEAATATATVTLSTGPDHSTEVVKQIELDGSDSDWPSTIGAETLFYTVDPVAMTVGDEFHVCSESNGQRYYFIGYHGSERGILGSTSEPDATVSEEDEIGWFHHEDAAGSRARDEFPPAHEDTAAAHTPIPPEPTSLQLSLIG